MNTIDYLQLIEERYRIENDIYNMRMKTISDFIENELTRHRDIVDKLTLYREETELEGYVKPKKKNQQILWFLLLISILENSPKLQN